MSEKQLAHFAEGARRDKRSFSWRLSRIPGVETLPAIGDWILLRVPRPDELARRVSRQVGPGLVTVPRLVQGVVKVEIRDAWTNERLLGAIGESLA